METVGVRGVSAREIPTVVFCVNVRDCERCRELIRRRIEAHARRVALRNALERRSL